jgi:hypothetical protein
MKMVSRFKYVTWNISCLGEKEGELGKYLNENNIKVPVFTEREGKL